MNAIVSLFIANAVAHIISYLQLKKNQSPDATGVLVFVFVNAIIAILLWQGMDWAKWLALGFPALGGIALLTTTIFKGKGTWIDFVILVLDIAIIGLVLKHYIL